MKPMILTLCCRLYNQYSPPCHTLFVFVALLTLRVGVGGLLFRFSAGLLWLSI